jgi:putative zinc finger/helix-turn-helix YgiT family protein
MICFKCKGEEFVTQTASVRQEFRDEQLDVTTPVCVCSACGWQTLGPGQTDELRKRTADAYREQHDLLTSVQIKAIRKLLGKNQREFAAFLGVGEASVKRWETWLVQEKSSDQLIRIKCDYDTFSYKLPKGVALRAGGVVIVRGQFDVTTYMLNTLNLTLDYTMQPIGFLSNVSRFTNRVTSEGQLAAFSKEWRKKHSKTCDADLIQCL